VASLSQGRTAAAQCGLFTHKSVPVIFEPPCIIDCPRVSIWFLSPLLTVRISHTCPSAFPLELYFVNTHFYFSSLLLINSITRHFAGHSPFCYQCSSRIPWCRLLETIYTEKDRLEIRSNSYEGFSVYPTITCMFK